MKSKGVLEVTEYILNYVGNTAMMSFSCHHLITEASLKFTTFMARKYIARIIWLVVKMCNFVDQSTCLVSQIA